MSELGFAYGFGRVGGSSTATGPSTDPLISSINADGWSATYSETPPTFDPENDPHYVVVTRNGFNGSGAAASFAEAIPLTKRIRQPYPNHASPTADQVALARYVFSTDTVPGLTSNSTKASPRPVAKHAWADRRVIGDTFPALWTETVAAHMAARNGEEVACVKFIWSDGANSVTQTVSASVISDFSGDKNPVIVYRATGDVDLSSLADGQITLDKEVYPHVGTAASVRKTADETPGTRTFCTQFFTKNPALFAAPPYAYVSASGVDATVDANGVASGNTKVSTNAATAAANPFLTLGSAIQALKAATNITGGYVDGCVIRIDGSVAQGLVAAGTYNANASLVIEGVAGTTPTLALTANWNNRLAYYWFRDMAITRTGGAWQVTSASASAQIAFENVAFDSGALNGAFAILAAPMFIMGMTFTGTGTHSTTLGPASNQQCRLTRGISSAVAGLTVDNFCVLGSDFVGISGAAAGTSYADSQAFVGFNRFMKYTGTGGNLMGTRGDASAPPVDGMAFIQNLVEWSGTGNNAAIKPSADSFVCSVTHLVMHHNTIAGFDAYGRGNILYDEHASIARTHDLCAFVGNIHTQINTKGDIFLANGARLGNFAYHYGVECEGEFAMFRNASAGALAFGQDFPGMKASIGTSNTVRNDPLFFDYQAVTSGPVAGAGDGTYNLQSGSPAAGRVTRQVLKWDLAGDARLAIGASGTYEL